MNGRVIGIRHRVKKTAAGEARPTLVAIIDGDQTTELELKTEDDEIDFVLGQLPVAWREATVADDVSALIERHVKIRADKSTGAVISTKVPAKSEGLRAGDAVAIIMGGSGDYLAYAVARRLGEIGGEVIRIKPADLKRRRDVGNKVHDHLLIANLAQTQRGLFRPMLAEDLQVIELGTAYRNRQDAMKARVACEQRLHQRTVGQIFVVERLTPESSVKAAYLARKANDAIHQALQKEEAERDRELEAALAKLAVWQKVFQPVVGIGPRIAAAIIVAVGNVLAFPTKAQFKMFCGVGLSPDGQFLRWRKGQTSNWSPEVRQALYLLGDQSNRRPDSEWGQRLLGYKAQFREKHPQTVVGENGKKRYTDGHIHRMAMWRTLTKFAERLYRDWTRLAEEERQTTPQEKVA